MKKNLNQQKKNKQLLNELSKLKRQKTRTDSLQAKLTKTINILRESEEKFHSFVSQSADGITIYDTKGIILEWNQGMERITGIEKNKAIGLYIWDLLYQVFPKELKTPKGKTLIKEAHLKLIDGILSMDREFLETKMQFPDSAWGYIQVNIFPIEIEQGYLVGTICRDITKIKQQEKEIETARDNLERQVRNRTKKLLEINKELEKKSATLEELNIALKVLLKKRDEDRQELEEKIVCNVKQLITPNLEKLLASTKDQHQRDYLEIIISNVNDIISPFSRTLTLNFLKLTPQEIYIANLVKEGKTTKEIAELMNLSIRTIDSHRDHIRKKLGLKSKTENLRTYLLAISNT